MDVPFSSVTNWPMSFSLFKTRVDSSRNWSEKDSSMELPRTSPSENQIDSNSPNLKIYTSVEVLHLQYPKCESQDTIVGDQIRGKIWRNATYRRTGGRVDRQNKFTNWVSHS